MKDYLDGAWTIAGDGITCTHRGDHLAVCNRGSDEGSIRLRIKRRPRSGWYIAALEGSIAERTAGPLYFVDEGNRILGDLSIGSTALFHIYGCQELALYVPVPAQCSFTFTDLSLEKTRRRPSRPDVDYCDVACKSRVAVIVPTYPTQENKYLCAFVHARVKAYREAGLDVDVICVRDMRGYGSYEYEGVRVLRAPIAQLGHLIARRGYDAVAIHFFDESIARAIDGQGLGKTHFVLWSHNPETRYWEWPLFTTSYFTEPPALTDEQKALFSQRDEIIKSFNAKRNVSWVFISELQKQRAQELVGTTFDRALVIPNLVDDQLFPYRPKDPDLRFRVFCVRKFDDVATYAVDIDVAAVLELSKRPVFKQMEFDFFGDGPLFDTLLEPVRHLENVHVHRTFLTHEQIAQQHAAHGIGLFATRFDSQGVSMCEAALSGLAVVSSNIDAARFFLPDDLGLLCPVEHPAAYADAIERLVCDPDYFAACSKACHDKVYARCRREMTIDKEIALLKGTSV